MKVQIILNNIEYTMNMPEWVKTIAQLKNNIMNDTNNYKFKDIEVTFEENEMIYEPYDTDIIENVIYILTISMA